MCAPASLAVLIQPWPSPISADSIARLHRVMPEETAAEGERSPARLMAVACRCWRGKSAVRRQTSGV